MKKKKRKSKAYIASITNDLIADVNKGLSSKELAEKYDISITVVNKIKRGDYPPQSLII